MRRFAGVSDPTWSPPEDEHDSIPRWRDFERDYDWRHGPLWTVIPGGYALGSRWNLTQPASIVAPECCAMPTLALVNDARDAGRYGIEAGTQLTLVRTYDPAEDEELPADAVTYYERYEGSESRTYRIDDGPSAGVLLTFPANPNGGRFPYSSVVALSAIIPLDPF